MTAPARPCGCLTRGVTAVDQARHAAWHELVGPEVGPAGLAETRAAAGLTSAVIPHGETHLDREARRTGRRASGKQREAAR